MEEEGYNSLDYLFLRAVSGWRFLKVKEPEVPVEERGKVEILTVHAMKGLERDRVFIVDLADFFSTRSPSYPLLWVEVLGGSVAGVNVQLRKGRKEVYRRVAEESVAERNRLLYVAFTRAKRGLHVFSHTNKRARKDEKDFISHVLKSFSAAGESSYDDFSVVHREESLEPLSLPPFVFSSEERRGRSFARHRAERVGLAFHEVLRAPRSAYYRRAYPELVSLAGEIREFLREKYGEGVFEMWLCSPKTGEFYRVDLYYPQHNLVVEFKYAEEVRKEHEEQVKRYLRLLREVVGDFPRALLILGGKGGFEVLEPLV